MRRLALILIVSTLASCASVERQGSDGFYPAGVTSERFAADTQHCQIEADDFLAYDVRGQDGTRYARNRTFNSVYGRCMRARGYRPRPYVRNLLPS